MRRASVMFMNPDFSMQELGELDVAAAEEAFESALWSDGVHRAESMDSQGENCVGPNMTFTLAEVHLTAYAETAEEFNVEVCVPREKKLLGLFSRVKFYELRKLDREGVKRAVRAFMTESHEIQHDLFGRLAGGGA